MSEYLLCLIVNVTINQNSINILLFNSINIFKNNQIVFIIFQSSTLNALLVVDVQLFMVK